MIISAPSRATDYSIPEKKLLLEIWSSCPTSIFDWEQAYWFVALDSYEARLMIEISVEIKTHYIEIYPDTLMYMEKDDDATILEQFHMDLQYVENLQFFRMISKILHFLQKIFQSRSKTTRTKIWDRIYGEYMEIFETKFISGHPALFRIERVGWGLSS